MANGIPPLPEIPAEQQTPLVEALLAVICAQQDRIAKLEETVQLLRDEIAILKGQKPRPCGQKNRLNANWCIEWHLGRVEPAPFRPMSSVIRQPHGRRNRHSGAP